MHVFMSRFGVRIGWGKYLNECAPFGYVSLWCWKWTNHWFTIVGSCKWGWTWNKFTARCCVSESLWSHILMIFIYSLISIHSFLALHVKQDMWAICSRYSSSPLGPPNLSSQDCSTLDFIWGHWRFLSNTLVDLSSSDFFYQKCT